MKNKKKELDKTKKQLNTVQFFSAFLVIAILIALYYSYKAKLQNEQLTERFTNVIIEQIEFQCGLKEKAAFEKCKVDSMFKTADEYRIVGRKEIAMQLLLEALAIDSNREDIRSYLNNMIQNRFERKL